MPPKKADSTKPITTPKASAVTLPKLNQSTTSSAASGSTSKSNTNSTATTKQTAGGGAAGTANQTKTTITQRLPSISIGKSPQKTSQPITLPAVKLSSPSKSANSTNTNETNSDNSLSQLTQSTGISSEPPLMTVSTKSPPLVVLSEEEKVKQAQLTQIELEKQQQLQHQREIEERLALYGTGDVILIYEMYNESFPIIRGSISSSQIDELYCLSDVMPGCVLKLSTFPPSIKREKEIQGEIDLFLPEDPPGVFHTLEKDKSYYVYVEQKEEQLKRDQERMRRIAAGIDTSSQGLGVLKDNNMRDDGRVMESCSCIYGNPCVDEYGCKNWSERFAIASKNGWKGF